uniref:Uncharacterized protein n=1 Tax=Pseudomonas phage HRDY3 TaxID=3236930 RepID=A0AB39CE48_9VIRU
MKISREKAKQLASQSAAMMGLPAQIQIVLDSVITHLVCVTEDYKNNRLEIVLGLNNPEPSAHIRHMAEQGTLYCVWQGQHMLQGPAFYPDDNETGLEHWEVEAYDSYLTFYVETE